MKRLGPMKATQRTLLGAVAAAVLLGLGECSGMSTQDRNTAIGAVGGIIGHEVSDDD